MPGNELLNDAIEGVDINRSHDADHSGNIIGGISRFEFVQEP
jgi:hypothetical protein